MENSMIVSGAPDLSNDIKNITNHLNSINGILPGGMMGLGGGNFNYFFFIFFLMSMFLVYHLFS